MRDAEWDWVGDGFPLAVDGSFEQRTTLGKSRCVTFSPSQSRTLELTNSLPESQDDPRSQRTRRGREQALPEQKDSTDLRDAM